MRRPYVTALAGCAWITWSFAAAAAPVIRVAVVTIKAVGVDEAASAALPGVVAQQISNHRGFAAVGADAVVAKQPANCAADDACLARMAPAVPADFVVIGQLRRDGQRFALDLRLVDPREAKRNRKASETMRRVESVALNVELCLKSLFEGLVPPPEPVPPALPVARNEAPPPAAPAVPPAPPVAAKTTPPKPKNTKRSLALITVTRGEGFSEKQANTLEEILLGALDGTHRFKVIGRTDITALLNLESQKQTLGCGDDAACMAQIAGALGADLVGTADIGRLGSTMVISLKLIDVASATVVVRVQQRAKSEEALADGIQVMANDVVLSLWPDAIITAPTPPTPAVVAAPPPTPTPTLAPSRSPAPAMATIPPAVTTPAPIPAPVVANPGTPRWLRNAGWAATAVGLVGIAVAAGLGASAASMQTHLKTTKQDGAAALNEVNSANSRALGANILFGAGGAVGVAGLVVLVAF